MNINSDLQYIKGIGPKRYKKLNKLNLFTIKDVLYYFPRQYEDRSEFKNIGQLVNEEKTCVFGEIIEFDQKAINAKTKISKILISDGSGYCHLVFFNQDYILNNFSKGQKISAFGKVKKEFYKIELHNCEVEAYGENRVTGKIVPIYNLTYGITNKELQSTISTVIKNCKNLLVEYLPKDTIVRNKLCGLVYAIENIHEPKDVSHLKIALYRLVFEEFLILQIGLYKFKSSVSKNVGISFKVSPKLQEVINSLKFTLTNAQMKALDEMLGDMKNTAAMNRLMQGDVGCGKTVIALLGLANVVLNGYQGAYMAPTEILAEQHYASFREILSDFNMKCELLVGSVTKKQKEIILEKVKKQEIDILIGTHALIEDNVQFNKLGMVITDEQHRFGVRQREKLTQKGNNPDVLVMTATPIPRTLALILYGDLDITIINELPPGRQKIDTFALSADKRKKAYDFAKTQVDLGRQVYIVCPLVEESEVIMAKAATELVEELKNDYFSDLTLGLLHGKMKASEKDEIMKNFKNHKIDILVSTTVIEVGVNVPNATLMIVENAERFGLAQLHQLRGRVGRGSHKSYCILIYSSKSETTLKRMKIMEQTTDGFIISEKDLEIRGPGEFFGTRQHGIPELKIANIFKHMKILKTAQLEAQIILREDKEFSSDNNKLFFEETAIKFKHLSL